MRSMDDVIHVTPDGYLYWQDERMRCALGKGGVSTDKREGDGATPVGVFPLRAIYRRADRLIVPDSELPTYDITPAMGWCDDAALPEYNTLVVLPFEGRHEEMWREDHCYDVVIEVGYNDAPVVPGKGSAIFIHLAKPGYAPTEGCVALALEDMLFLLAGLTAGTKLHIHAADDYELIEEDDDADED